MTNRANKLKKKKLDKQMKIIDFASRKNNENMRDVLLMQAKLNTAEQEFYNAVTPTDFANSFNGGSDSTIVLNDVTVKTHLILPPPSIKLSDKDKAHIMAFNYEEAARTYAERRAEKL